jgi:anaerobic magnesium-protoporphyrin IX monomethyl ester cyclase
VRIALVYPPTCDPTAPYVSVPLLTGWLRSRGVEVLPVDANIGACDSLLRPPVLAGLRARVHKRFRALDRGATMPHGDQRQYLAYLDALRQSSDLEKQILPAMGCLRGTDPGFHDPAAYAHAVDVVTRSLALVGAAHGPLELSFASYRSPFSLLNPEERSADSLPERNPYHAHFTGALIPALLDRGVRLIGISVVFPGQIQPAYSLAYLLKASPDARGIHVTVGGPAMTQILARLEGTARERALEPFDTAVLYEGEEALLGLVREIEAGGEPRGVVMGSRLADLSVLPAPDFDGMPLDRYLSPEPVLPYDLSRGCPWGKCAFCHYGLAESGTAPYRERPLDQAVRHLRLLRERHGARLFYLSEDSVRPETLVSLATSLAGEGTDIRWSTDVRPEPLLAEPGVAAGLRLGGALSFSFGVESGSRRVLKLMRKGTSLEGVRAAIRAAAEAGIAAEAMVFTDFPTENGGEAMETLALLGELAPWISLFMCGTFGLSAGSAVAREPGRFGIAEVWSVSSDELGLGLQYTPGAEWKSEQQRVRIDKALAALSAKWRFASYPWAGSLSTAHTMLWYDRAGPAVFRLLAARSYPTASAAPRAVTPRYDPDRLGARFAQDEARIWETMVADERAVSRARYQELAADIPPALPRANLRRSGGSSSRDAGPRRGGDGRGSRPPAPRRPGAAGDR